MAEKRRFRIEGGRYGGEAVLGEVNPNFVRYYVDQEENELVEAVLNTDDWTNDDDDRPLDELVDPNTPPTPHKKPGDDYYMWENDEYEHINNAYADGEFFVYEVPTDGSDDWDYEKEVYEGEGQYVYSREGAYLASDEPTKDESPEDYIPTLLFHSSEKGSFPCWFLETEGEDFDQYKLGFGQVETDVGEFIDRVYYDKVELEDNYDNAEGTGKGYYAVVGWLNKKWHDSYAKYNKLEEDDWLEYDEYVADAKETNGD